MRRVPRPGLRRGDVRARVPLDELAAKLELDPLELRRRNYADSRPERRAPVLAKNLLELLRRGPSSTGAPRTSVRAPERRPWQRGVGVASQIWYGGGGPPSYAWIRLGVDGRARSSPRCRTSAPARAPRWRRSPPRSSASRSTACAFVARRHGARPYASTSAGSSTIAVDGPGRARGGGRREAPDASRSQPSGTTSRSAYSHQNGEVVSSDGGSWPLETSSACSTRRRSSARAPAARTRPGWWC